MSDPDKMTVAKLRATLKAKDLDSTGNKAALVKRLKEAQAKKSPAKQETKAAEKVEEKKPEETETGDQEMKEAEEAKAGEEEAMEEGDDGGDDGGDEGADAGAEAREDENKGEVDDATLYEGLTEQEIANGVVSVLKPFEVKNEKVEYKALLEEIHKVLGLELEYVDDDKGKDKDKDKDKDKEDDKKDEDKKEDDKKEGEKGGARLKTSQGHGLPRVPMDEELVKIWRDLAKEKEILPMPHVVRQLFRVHGKIAERYLSVLHPNKETRNFIRSQQGITNPSQLFADENSTKHYQLLSNLETAVRGAQRILAFNALLSAFLAKALLEPNVMEEVGIDAVKNASKLMQTTNKLCFEQVARASIMSVRYRRQLLLDPMKIPQKTKDKLLELPLETPDLFCFKFEEILKKDGVKLPSRPQQNRQGGGGRDQGRGGGRNHPYQRGGQRNMGNMGNMGGMGMGMGGNMGMGMGMGGNMGGMGMMGGNMMGGMGGNMMGGNMMGGGGRRGGNQFW